MNGHGIDSMAEIFLDFGYIQKDELRFPAKKLKAYWFSPPAVSCEDGSGVNGPLPRIFISELLVDQMSPEAQVHLYTLFLVLFSTNISDLVTFPSGVYLWMLNN